MRDRVSKTRRTPNGTTRSYYYDRGVAAFTLDGTSLSAANVLDAEGDAIGTYRGSTYYTYLKDGQASTTSMVKQDGSLAAAYDYTDFGETTEITGSGVDNQICYTGGIYDKETGLYYLNARYYDPEIGRFISQDSYRGELNDPDQWHLYAYCANNPINYVDPSGHFVWALPVAFMAISASSVIEFLGGALCSVVAGVLVGTSISRIKKIWSNISVNSGTISTMLSSMRTAVKKGNKKGRSKRSVKHHIVAKIDTRATESREILEWGGVGKNSNYNLIKLKEHFHQHLHTNAYHSGVKEIMKVSKQFGNGINNNINLSDAKEKKVKNMAVRGGLRSMKVILGAANVCAK